MPHRHLQQGRQYATYGGVKFGGIVEPETKGTLFRVKRAKVRAHANQCVEEWQTHTQTQTQTHAHAHAHTQTHTHTHTPSLPCTSPPAAFQQVLVSVNFDGLHITDTRQGDVLLSVPFRAFRAKAYLTYE